MSRGVRADRNQGIISQPKDFQLGHCPQTFFRMSLRHIPFRNGIEILGHWKNRNRGTKLTSHRNDIVQQARKRIIKCKTDAWLSPTNLIDSNDPACDMSQLRVESLCLFRLNSVVTKNDPFSTSFSRQGDPEPKNCSKPKIDDPHCQSITPIRTFSTLHDLASGDDFNLK